MRGSQKSEQRDKRQKRRDADQSVETVERASSNVHALACYLYTPPQAQCISFVYFVSVPYPMLYLYFGSSG